MGRNDRPVRAFNRLGGEWWSSSVTAHASSGRDEDEAVEAQHSVPVVWMAAGERAPFHLGQVLVSKEANGQYSVSAVSEVHGRVSVRSLSALQSNRSLAITKAASWGRARADCIIYVNDAG